MAHTYSHLYGLPARACAFSRCMGRGAGLIWLSSIHQGNAGGRPDPGVQQRPDGA